MQSVGIGYENSARLSIVRMHTGNPHVLLGEKGSEYDINNKMMEVGGTRAPRAFSDTLLEVAREHIPGIPDDEELHRFSFADNALHPSTGAVLMHFVGMHGRSDRLHLTLTNIAETQRKRLQRRYPKGTAAPRFKAAEVLLGHLNTTPRNDPSTAVLAPIVIHVPLDTLDDIVPTTEPHLLLYAVAQKPDLGDGFNLGRLQLALSPGRSPDQPATPTHPSAFPKVLVVSRS